MKNFLVGFSVVFLGFISIPSYAFHRFEQVDTEGKVWRGSDPVNREDLDLLESKGIKTILSFDSTFWFQENAHLLSLIQGRNFKFLKVPILPVFKKIDPQTFREIIEILNNPENQPIFFHCLLGSDRTSLVAFFYELEVMGKTTQEAHQSAMVKHNFNTKLRTLNNFYEQYKAPGALYKNTSVTNEQEPQAQFQPQQEEEEQDRPSNQADPEKKKKGCAGRCTLL